MMNSALWYGCNVKFSIHLRVKSKTSIYADVLSHVSLLMSLLKGKQIQNIK